MGIYGVWNTEDEEVRSKVSSTVTSSRNYDVHRHICLVPIGVAGTEIHGDRVRLDFCIVGPSSLAVPGRQKYGDNY